jgi:hypothetical protein
LNPGHRGEKPATNRLSYGAAYEKECDFPSFIFKTRCPHPQNYTLESAGGYTTKVG